MPSLVISLLSSRISLQNREKRRFEPTFKKVRPARLSGRKILISSGFQRGQGLQKRPQNGHPRHSCIKDSKFLEAPAVSSAENVHRTGLCAGSDFTILYCSCVFFLHSSGAGITLEVYGELSERSKVRHSKSCFHFGSPNCRKASNHAGLRASSNCELGSVLSCCSSQFPRLEFCGKMAIMRAAI